MKQFILSLILSMSLASLALASDLTQQQSVLYPFQNSIQLQEEFISGGTGTGGIGHLGWAAVGGTFTLQNSEANRFGIFRQDTSAASGTISRMFLNIGSVATIDPALPSRLLFASRLNTNDANTTLRIGAQNSPQVSPPADGIFFEKLDADANWFCVTRAATVQTRTDSTVAVNTSFNTFAYTRNSSGVQFAINNVNVCGLHTTNIPTVFISPSITIVNSAAASKTVDTDYFEITITGLVR